MNDETLLHGGCLCGALRYVVLGPAAQTTVCHCSDCRHASGAPFVAWTFFRSGALSWTAGRPKMIHFAGRERSFCGDCGTPLVFFDPGIPEWFEVSTCSLDDPDPHLPVDECWMGDRIGWLESVGKLPGYDANAPLPGES
jgi:hypothetical protein